VEAIKQTTSAISTFFAGGPGAGLSTIPPVSRRLRVCEAELA
jgi:hypothetical protein